eukprot:gene32124-16644_t
MYGTTPAMWAPVVAFAHVFASYWLIKTLALARPGLFVNAGRPVWKALLQCISRGKHSLARAWNKLNPQSKWKPAFVDIELQESAPGTEDAPGDQDICQDEEARWPQPLPAAAVMRRATTHVHPVNLEWRELGCTYK